MPSFPHRYSADYVQYEPPSKSARRPSLASYARDSAPSSIPSYDRRASVVDLSIRLPPPIGEALAPLTLDPSRARELEREAPLALPRPWGVEREYPVSSAAATSVSSGVTADLSRTRSRSPARVRGSSFSAIPPEVPKTKFVEGLVDAACIAVDVVWKVTDSPTYQSISGLPTPAVSPASSRSSSSPEGSSNVLPLRHFIKEVLRRSRSTCSTLQTALYYIHKSREAIRDRVRQADDAKNELLKLQRPMTASGWNGASLPSPPYDNDVKMSPRTAAILLQKTRDPVLCGRRMFLAALVCASKFLQDRTYSNRAWAKISSLPVQEINANEKAFLELLDYNLYVNAELFKNWTRRLQDLAEKQARKVAQLQAMATSGEAGPIQPLRSSVTMLREGLGRSQSDYLPAPELTEVTRVGSNSVSPRGSSNGYHYPLTPKDTPRVPSSSPLRTFSQGHPAHLAALSRSQTDSRLEHTFVDRKLPPIGAGMPGHHHPQASSVSGFGRLPLPTLSVKIPQYLTPSPSPLSGQSYGGEADESIAQRLSTSHPARRQPTVPAGRASYGEDGLRLPRPSLSVPASRYTSSSSIETLKQSPNRSTSCSSLARLLNAEGAEWNPDQMVL